MIRVIQSWLDEKWEMNVNAKMTTIEKVKEFINNLMRQDRWIHVDRYYNNEGPLDEDCTLWECKIRHDRSRLDAFPHDKIIVTCVSLHGGSRGEVHGTDSLEDIVWLAGKRAGIPEDQQQILIVDKRRKGFDFFADEAMSIKCSCGLVHHPPVIPARPQDMRHSGIWTQEYEPRLGRLWHCYEGLEDSSESSL